MGVGGIDGPRQNEALDASQAANAAGPAGAADAPADGLALGARGPEVKSVQEELKLLHYPVGTPDGIYGRATASAVAQFQKKHGLPTTGVCDSATEFVLHGTVDRKAIDGAIKKFEEYFRANAGKLAPPLSQVDPRSFRTSDFGDYNFLDFKLKGGKPGYADDPSGKALAALVKDDPLLKRAVIGADRDM